MLYGCETGTSSLHQIDILTGNASSVPGITLPGVHSLAFDSASNRLIVKDFSSIYFAPLSSQATQQISGYVQLLLANHGVEVGAPPAAVASRSPTPLVRIHGAQYGGPVI